MKTSSCGRTSVGKLDWHFSGVLGKYLGDWPDDQPSVTLGVTF
jgi:hypothetical protein